MESIYNSEPLIMRYKKIRNGDGPIKLTEGPIAVLHISPISDGPLDLRAVADDQKRILALLFHNHNPQQIFSNSLIFNNDNISYLELLSDGKIEIASSLNSSIETDQTNKESPITQSTVNQPLFDYQLERHLWHCIRRNINFYRNQGQSRIKAPIEIHLALLDIKNLKLENLKGKQYLDKDLILQPEMINDFKNDIQINIAIHNMANKIWAAFGGSQSIHFNPNHTFIERSN